MTLFSRVLSCKYISTLIVVPIIVCQCEVTNTNRFSLFAQAQAQTPPSQPVTVTLTQEQFEELEKNIKDELKNDKDELRNDIEAKHEKALNGLNAVIIGLGVSLGFLTAFPFLITLLVIVFNQSIVNYLNRDAIQEINNLNKQIESTQSKLNLKSEILDRLTSAFIFRQIMDLLPEVKLGDYLSRERREKIYNNIEKRAKLILEELKKLDSDELKLPNNLKELIELLKEAGNQYFLRSIDYIKLGDILMFVDKYQDAITFYDYAIKLAPETQLKAYNKKGVCLYKKHDLKGAEICFEKCLEIDPSVSKPWTNLGMVYFDNHNFPEAQRFAEAAIIREPTNAVAYNNLGNALLRRGKKEEALRNYQKSIEINPSFYHPYYNMACLYASDNHPDLVIEKLEKAIKLNSKAREDAKTDPDFRQLRENNESFRNLIGLTH